MPAPTTVKTTCCYCGVGCGIVVSTDAKGRRSLAGDADHPANRGMLCSKGRTLLHAALSRSERLTTPQMRQDRKFAFRPTTWDEALGRAAAEFKRIIAQHGPDAVAFYGSGQLLTEEYFVLNKLVKGFIGTNNLDTNSRLCMSSAVAGYKQTLGKDGPPTSYADIPLCDTFLVAGANPAWAHPIVWRQVEARKAADPNVRIIVVDPRRTATAASADLHLQIRPGTDVALFYGLGQRLIETGAIDREFLAQYVNGFDAYAAAAAPLTLAKTADVCGLTQTDIAKAAEWLAGDRRFLSIWTMGLNQSAMGVDKNTTLIALSLLTGKIGRPGCGPFSLTGQPNAMGGREVGGMANLASNHRELNDPTALSEIAQAWGVPSVPAKPGLTAVELFQAVRDGTVKAVWILATNPVESLPDAWAVDAALDAAELVVCQDIFPTATSAKAHIVLPAATWLEKCGTMTNSDRTIALLSPAIEPPGDALPDRVILQRFARAMGWERSFSYSDEAAIFAEHAALSRGRDCDISGLSHARLANEGPLQWPVPSPAHPGTPRLYSDLRFPTADGKATLKAPAFADRSEPLTAEFPLVLTTGRLRDQWHTQTRTGRVRRLGAHAPVPELEIHPRDAAERGIAQGDFVAVRGSRGEVRVRAKVTEEIRPGVVYLPMHWGRLTAGDLGRTNNLTSPRIDPVSKEPDLKLAAVQVAKHVPTPRRILVVGAGAATRGFLEAHAAAGLGDTITVLGDEPGPFYNRVLLPHYISGHNDFPSMVTTTEQDLIRQRVEFRSGVKVASIDRPGKAVVDAEGNRHPYDLLVLATGSRAARHYLGPMPKRGVHSLRRKADGDALRAEAGPGRRAVIVGGGLLGLELADALNHLGCAVTVLQRSDKLMGKQLDATASAHLAALLAERGIAVRFKAGVDELLGGDRLTGIRLSNSESIPADLVAFATGTAPNAELARVAGLTCSTGVIIDQGMITSDPHIAAIGEVAEFKGRLPGTTASAEDQARMLVEHLRGNPHTGYRGPQDAAILKVHGVQLAAMGDLDDSVAGTEILRFEDPAEGIYQTCAVREGRLVGVILFGDISGFPDYKALIVSGTELEDKRSALLRGGGSAKKVEGRLVCSCNQVGEATIIAAAKACGGDPAKVCTSTGAGTACGSCRSEVARIVAAAVATVPA